MTALEQAAELQEKAITILLAERDAIDQRLQQLGHGERYLQPKRRGRPPRSESIEQEKNLRVRGSSFAGFAVLVRLYQFPFDSLPNALPVINIDFLFAAFEESIEPGINPLHVLDAIRGSARVWIDLLMFYST